MPTGPRILFITATRIGDAVISTGILKHLLRQNPTARVTVACGPVAAGVFQAMPQLERLILMPKQKMDGHWFKLWGQTLGTRWDQVIDLRGSGTALFLLARHRQILKGGRRPGSRLGQLAESMGIAPPPLPIAWYSEADRARARALLPNGAPYIGLGPTANWAGKVWPPERFVALFQRLRAHALPDARPVIFAGPGPAEAALAQPVRDALPDAIDLTGRLTLPQAAACLARTALFVGNDSGLMHLAAAAGAPTLGLFGPSPVDEYAPSGRRTAVAVAPGPAGKAPMDGLTVEAAAEVAMALLKDEGRIAA
ncbi:glycosyltransferase family 9 protein [Acidisoma cellulosilyticum]|uniref:glycosyltransferase family 9 protein n=1 Tax=Acidisoma cellulosilyticum TaxID=2802395 RepID=UPI001D0B6765|nr:glycosyltransferase family 9 protein [Acidisoma cellulosilyticum]